MPRSDPICSSRRRPPATLQVVNANASGNVVNSLSATATMTSLTSGNPPLPLFLDGTQPITGALTSGGSQTTGLAGRITVNGALPASPASLVVFAANTSAGDSTRPNFTFNQMTSAFADLLSGHRHRPCPGALSETPSTT